VPKDHYSISRVRKPLIEESLKVAPRRRNGIVWSRRKSGT